ncbi:MAG: hypothetical protein VW268_03015 [Rhodospirillaceae bacterium]
MKRLIKILSVQAVLAGSGSAPLKFAMAGDINGEPLSVKGIGGGPKYLFGK